MCARKIKLADNTLSAEELYSLAEWMKTGAQLTKGPLTSEFEDKFSSYVGSKYATFVNSGSSANLLAVCALEESGRLRNKIAIAPAISWCTTVAPLMQRGFDIKLCDCDPSSLGFDLDHFERLCYEFQPGAAIAVHVLGHTNDMPRLLELCRRYKVELIEDCCEALGSRHRSRHVGTFGVAGTFSFYYGHHITTLEGGMVVTDDNSLQNIVKSLRAHGWARDVDRAIASRWEEEFDIDEIRGLYTFYFPGFNFRSTDLNAFLGLSQMGKLDSIIRRRQAIFEYFQSRVGGQFWMQSSDAEPLSSFALGVLVRNRLDVFRHLKDSEIESRPLVCGNIGLQPFWVKRFGETRLKNADAVHEFGMYLPNHPSLSDADVERLVGEFAKVAIPYDPMLKGKRSAGKKVDGISA